jgi:hypothetical protein
MGEPDLITDTAFAGVLAERWVREAIFHGAESGTSRTDFAKLMARDFCEVGASGRRYSREYVLDELEKRQSIPLEDVWEAKDFHCRKLGHDVYLLTYTLLQDHRRLTRRSSIWQRTDEGWRIIFHQGTIVAAD